MASMEREPLISTDATFQTGDEKKNLALKSHLLGTVFKQSTLTTLRPQILANMDTNYLKVASNTTESSGQNRT
jgi:hypothetical protein